MSRALIFGSVQFRLGDEAAKSGKGFAEIDFKKLVHRNSQPPSSLPICNPPTDSLVSAIEPAKSRIDNIIEKLEKKYSNPITFEDGAESEVEVEVSDRDSHPTNVTSKKRKRKSQDTYDMGDSFIDDTEAYMEVEKAYASQRVKTKHSGFFVNSGALEVTRNNDQESSETSEGVTEEKRFKVLKHPEMEAAFEGFRLAVSESTNVKLYRHRFPPALNDALQLLDAEAQRLRVHLEHDYYACVSDAINGALPANKIKSHLLQCRKHNRATQAKAEVESLCSKFSNYIMQFLRRVEASEVGQEDVPGMPPSQVIQPSQSDDGEASSNAFSICQFKKLRGFPT